MGASAEVGNVEWARVIASGSKEALRKHARILVSKGITSTYHKKYDGDSARTLPLKVFANQTPPSEESEE